VKRFRWRLQRVLDIAASREEALRADLLALAREIVRVRQEIVWRQGLVRQILTELAARDLADRLPEQAIVLECAAAEERILRRLRSAERDLRTRRDAKTAEFLRARGRRRTLERLRGEARERHRRDEDRREQKEFDELAHMAYARKGGVPT